MKRPPLPILEADTRPEPWPSRAFWRGFNRVCNLKVGVCTAGLLIVIRLIWISVESKFYGG